MFYGYNSSGYVVAIWESAPTERERQGLQVLQVDQPNAPTDGYWRVENGMLIQVPGSFERYERRLQRVASRRSRGNPELVQRVSRS